ncbi:Radial spoke head protein 4 A [Rhizophlyctis rosea]|nr:Radial spoke head protein 4 A [Rhizophlyctis rosea]
MSDSPSGGSRRTSATGDPSADPATENPDTGASDQPAETTAVSAGATDSQTNLARSARGSAADLAAPTDGGAAPAPPAGTDDANIPNAAPATEPPPVAETLPPTHPAYPFLYAPANLQDGTYKKPQHMLPEESEVALAKAFLMTGSEKSGLSVYDHLTNVVVRLLETRVNNAVDVFESISSEVKRSKFAVEQHNAPGAFRAEPDYTPMTEISTNQIKLFERLSPEEQADRAMGDSPAGEVPDVMDLANLWEWAGVSLSPPETFTSFLSMQNLAATKPLKSLRLWGKIFGSKGNYIIVEGEIRESAADDDEAAANADEEGEAGAGEGEGEPKEGDEAEKKEGEEAEGGEDKGAKKKVQKLPKEVRAGVNKYVYYVCSYAGGPWTRLPDVVPEKLQAARHVRKYFTGNLKEKVVSYPPFNGTEAQYLRCQIARISAATVISPQGYYTFDQEEGADEEEGQQAPIIINPDYESPTPDTLLSAANWVHHVPYVLPQGRVTWENPNPKERKEREEGDEEEEEPEEEEEEGEAVEPETGPGLLRSVGEDEDIGDHPTWLTRPCSHLSPLKFSPVSLTNTRWPGATTVAYNDKFANIYVGDGLKSLPPGSHFFIPPPLPEIQGEYQPKVPEDDEVPEGGRRGELDEQKDPTVEEEREFQEEMERRRAEGEDEAGSEAGEEEEEEEGDGEE